MFRPLLISLILVMLFPVAALAEDARHEFYRAQSEGLVTIEELNKIETACRDQRAYGHEAHDQCLMDEFSRLEVLTAKPKMDIPMPTGASMLPSERRMQETPLGSVLEVIRVLFTTI